MQMIARSPQQIGALLQRYRKEAGLSQAELASLVSLRQEQVSKIEGGSPGSRLSSICDLLAALNLELTIAPRSQTGADDIADIF